VKPISRKVLNYIAAGGRSPFREWIRLQDSGVRARMNVRLRRIEELGNYGDCEPIGEGVFELRIDTGPGYRIYFGIDGEQAILLGAGDKRSQMGDILKAKDCWKDYHAETDE